MGEALLIIDVQHGYADSNPLTTARIAAAAERARPHMPILWSYISWLDPCEPFRARKLALTKHFNIFAPRRGYPLVIEPAITPSPHDWVLPKSGMSVFGNRRVQPFLASQGISKLFVAGFRTEECVYFSARDAARLGFETSLATDLVADGRDVAFQIGGKDFAGVGVDRRPFAELDFG